MKTMDINYLAGLPEEMEQKIRELVKPGTVFGEPFRDGNTTIITASRVIARNDRLIAQPVGAILITPDGVELRRFKNPAEAPLILAFIAAIVFWLGMLMHPAWKPDTNLLEEVGRIIQTIREKND